MKTKLYSFKQLWTWILTGTMLILSPALCAQFPVCSNPNTLFGIDSKGGIYPINPATGTIGSLINTADYTLLTSYASIVANQTLAASSPNGLGYNNVNGKFYYFKRDPGGSNSQFVSYDPILNLYTTLAPYPGSKSIHAGCVNFGGTGYYCLDVQSYLYFYDNLSNTWRTITKNITDQFGGDVAAVITSQNAGDLAIDGYNQLWILPSSKLNFALYKLVAPLPTTPVASIVVEQIVPPSTATPSGVSLYGMAFDPMGNIYMSSSNSELFKLTTAIAAPVLVGTINTTGAPTDLTSCAFPLTVLPLKFTTFSATLKNKGEVMLSWKISEQDQNKGFYIEYSKDGINWKQIGFEENSHGGTIQDSYFFTDPNPGINANYYRIHAINFDGSGVYSPIRMVNMKASTSISLWPNPVTDVLNIQVGGGTSGGSNSYAIVFDMSGKVLLKNVLQPGINSVSLKKLPASTYLVQVQLNNGVMFNQKIIRQ